MHGTAAACGSARIPTGVLATVTAVVALMLDPWRDRLRPLRYTPGPRPVLPGVIWTCRVRSARPWVYMRTNRAFFTKLQYLFRY